MLQITTERSELYDEVSNTFSYVDPFELRLEHSLVSISKWEMKWEEPFLKAIETKTITDAQFLDYIRCMTMNQNTPEIVYSNIRDEQISQILEYINKKHSAAWISSRENPNRNVTITSDLIYFWMFTYNIPKECEKWHLNRLLMLIDIFAVKNNPDQKMSKQEIYAQNRALNEQRKQQMHTKG